MSAKPPPPQPSFEHPYRSAPAPLGEPPRLVPFALALQLWTGGTMALFGWAVFVFGCGFCWAFLPKADFRSLWVDAGPQQLASAHVTAVTPTHTSEDDRKVWAIEYQLDGANHPIAGRSYTTHAPPAVGGVVTAEYPVGRPRASHLVGMRRAPFSPAAGLMILFPLAGAYALVRGTRPGRRASALLRYGLVARGRLVDKRATKVWINDDQVYALRFEFEADDGRKYQAVAKTHRPAMLEDEPTEQILYLPSDPSCATLVDHLPGKPYVHPDGTLRGHSGGALLCGALVVLAVAVNVVAAWWALR